MTTPIKLIAIAEKLRLIAQIKVLAQNKLKRQLPKEVHALIDQANEPVEAMLNKLIEEVDTSLDEELRLKESFEQGKNPSAGKFNKRDWSDKALIQLGLDYDINALRDSELQTWNSQPWK